MAFARLRLKRIACEQPHSTCEDALARPAVGSRACAGDQRTGAVQVLHRNKRHGRESHIHTYQSSGSVIVLEYN